MNHHLIGRRVEIPAYFDAWMMGDRFGTIEAVTRQTIRVRLDRSGRLLAIPVGAFDSLAVILEA